MKAHDLAKHLLNCEDVEVCASVDISTGDEDSDRRIFTEDCMGVNSYNGDSGKITILFYANPSDNYGNKI